MSRSSSDSQFILVSYDIPSDKRRNKISKALKDYGERVQYSVFECCLKPEQTEKLTRRLQMLVNQEEDNIRIYQLCRACIDRITLVGNAFFREEEDEVYVV